MKNKLQIYLITYNRKKYLERTLKSILANNSPIKNFDITILDNASTDGSSELIQDYCTKYPNLKHIRHNINIGGNANICRAFEMGASCGKEYFWVLCDDDKYDFFNWREVEKNIEEHKDIICVSDYVCDTQEKKLNRAYQIFQLTFVPAGIYRADLISDNILTNMYDSIYTMFQQSCVVIDTINKNKNIKVLSKPIVFNGFHFEDRCIEFNYNRGSEMGMNLKRRIDTKWILGYSNILSLLKDETMKQECMECSIKYKDIYNKEEHFYNSMANYIINGNINYVYEIFQLLPRDRQNKLIKYISSNLETYLNKEKIIKSLNLSKEKFVDDNSSYLEKIFSVKNSKDRTHKVITILGVKLKFKIKKLC